MSNASELKVMQERAVRGLAAAMVVAIIAFVSALAVAKARDPEIVLTRERLTVRHGSMVASATRAQIDDVQLLSTIGGIGWKRSGYSGATTFRGRFALRGHGDAMLFLDTRRPPFILVRSPAGVVVFSAATPAATRMLFDSLRPVMH